MDRLRIFKLGHYHKVYALEVSFGNGYNLGVRRREQGYEARDCRDDGRAVLRICVVDAESGAAG
jgi:hypothetical protein